MISLRTVDPIALECFHKSLYVDLIMPAGHPPVPSQVTSGKEPPATKYGNSTDAEWKFEWMLAVRK